MTHGKPALQAFVMLSVTAVTAFGQDLERMAQARGMTGVATPLNLADAGADTIEIKLALDVHLFPPDFDVAKMAFLSDGKEISVPATAWNGKEDRHHISGVLSFPADDLRSANTLIMTLQRSERGDDLVFSWGPLCKDWQAAVTKA